MMVKKVTYTLDKSVINSIEKGSFLSDISQSKFLSHCIQFSYGMMVDKYYDNDKQPLVDVIRKRKNSIPKTFTIPIDVESTLSWFSKKLGQKKSHLVGDCVVNFLNESEKLSS